MCRLRIRRARSRRSSGCWPFRISTWKSRPTNARWALFIIPILIGLQAIPAIVAGGRGAGPDPRQPVVLGARVVAVVCVCEPRAGRRARSHLHRAVQGDQEEAPRLLLYASAVAADARRHERTRNRHRVAVSDDRRRRRARSGQRRRVPSSPDDPNLQAMSSERSEDRCSRSSRGRSTRSPCSRGARWAGAAGAPRRLSVFGFVIVLLNFLPINYFVTTSHTF